MIATITPNRGGERKELLHYCAEQIKGMGIRNSYILNDPPKSDDFDLVPRIRQGVEMAKADGMEYVFIIESDDWYNPAYIINVDLDFDFFGYSQSTYYNLRNRTHDTFTHPGRSSLFCTAFRVEALNGFPWPSDNTVFLDIHLWRWAVRKRKKIKLLKENPNLGVKHGIGKVGGKGHRLTMKRKDDDLSFLRSRVDDKGFQFYTELMKKL